MSKFGAITIMGEDGLPHALNFLDGSYSVVSIGMEYAIESGLCTAMSLVSKFGRNPSVPNGSYAIVWQTGTTPYPTWADSTAAEIVSDNANDTLLGSGARTIRIHGLEATTYAEKTLDVDMNGVTPVAIGNWARINRAYPIAQGGSGGIFGTGGVVGTVTIRVAGGGATLASIIPSYNQTEIAIWTIPAGKTGVMSTWYAGSPEAKSFEVQIVTRAYGNGGWRARDTKIIAQGSWPFPLDLALEPKTDVMVIAKGLGTSGIVDAGFKIVYEDVIV